MVLSKREKYVAAIAIAALAALLLDAYALTPFLERRARVHDEKQRLELELARAGALIARRGLLEAKWNEMLASGMKAQRADAESQVLHALRDWSEDCGLSLSSLKPERAQQNGRLQQIPFQAAGTGPMRAVARFLWQLESAPLPIKVSQLQLGARREGADDLSLQLRITALCLPADQAAPENGAAAAGR